jgi:PAS domain S-box-containing protein
MKKTPLHILMLEDDAFDAELNKAQLALLTEYDCNIVWVSDKGGFLREVTSNVPDIVLSDYNLPQYSGLDALNDLKSMNLLVPFIFVTGAMSEETAAETIKAGAWDYVVKDRLLRLPLAIRSALQLRGERLNAERSEEQNRILSSALAQSPVHVVICNVTGVVEYVNLRFAEITGFDPSEVMGWSLRKLSAPVYTESFWENLWALLLQGSSWRGEMQALKKDGTLFWESVSLSPLLNPSGAVTHFIAVKEDITHRKEIELELAEARDRAERSDRLKEAFLQNLSHEIRTPMNAIVGFAGLLGEPDLDKDSMLEYASIVQSSSAQLLSIVTDIVTIARIQTGQERVIVRPVFVNELVDNVLSRYKPKSNEKGLLLMFKKDNENPMPVIVTDESKLLQILSNLVQNAIKFTHNGSVEIGYRFDGASVDFYVKDTGIGIPDEAKEHIFERFRQADPSFSVKYGGTGLGLSISKSYATLLGGKLWVESELGKGSVFYLSIPNR